MSVAIHAHSRTVRQSNGQVVVGLSENADFGTVDRGPFRTGQLEMTLS
jgi:hypothetical protein